MTLRINIDAADNGYVITKWKRDMYGIPDSVKVAVDIYDLFVELAKTTDAEFDVLAVRFRRLADIELEIEKVN